MFLILLTYKKSLSEIDAALAAHRAFLDECYKNNALIASGPKVPRTGGVLLSQLQNRVDVEALIEQDPFYQEELADYEIIEFEAVKYHPDFKRFIKMANE